MNNHYKEIGALWVAGILGSVIALPYRPAMKTRTQQVMFLFTGVVTSYYLGPLVAGHFGMAQTVAAFLCGLLGGSVIAKAMDLIDTVRLGDFLAGFRGGIRS